MKKLSNWMQDVKHRMIILGIPGLLFFLSLFNVVIAKHLYLKYLDFSITSFLIISFLPIFSAILIYCCDTIYLNNKYKNE